jgi:hypothetical protein
MTKYFLTLFVNVSTESIDQMSKDLSSIADTDLVRYLHSDTNNALIFHFQTDLDPQELKELIYLTFCQYSTFFILTEMTENAMLGMSRENMEHLLSLDNQPVDFEENPTIQQVEEMLDEMTVDGEIDSELMAIKLMANVKKNSRIPTLNELLDKISDFGIESLNKFEKDILNSYSK